MKDFKYMDVTDLPSDINGSLGKVRTTLARAYNFNRDNPQKLQLLADTMVTILAAITKGLGTIDPNEVIDYQAYINQQAIDLISVSPGFTPIKKTKPKPKRAAKRTTQKDTK